MRANGSRFRCLILMGFLAVSAAYAQRPLLQITSPSNRALAPEGQTLTITVAADSSVQYFSIMGEAPLPEVQPTSSSTQFTLTLPTNIPPGLYHITAVGATSGGLVASAPIEIDVERQDTPKYLITDPDFLTLLSPGAKLPINVMGIYPTGGSLPLSKSTYTTYLSNDSQVVTVAPNGFVTAMGPGKTTVLIRYGSLSTTFEVTVEQPRPKRPLTSQ